MAEQEIKPFHFDLSETLYFHRNEGVSEMLGIGLDPEISIESHPDYVSVRGIIALTGEYLPIFVDEEREVEDDEEVQNRYFKRVERDEDGICDFLHHFPIDISIPHERIKNLDDLTVSVDHFDYHVSDPRKLELEATVKIDGLEYEHNREADNKPVKDEADPIDENTDTTDEENETEERIHFDVKLKEEEHEQENEVELDRPLDDPSKQDDLESTVVDAEGEKVVNFEKRFEPVLPKDERDLEQSVEEEDQGIQDEEAEVETDRADQSSYLLDLFDQSEQANDVFTQMKMYIVQEEDTLEEIAEKYQVSITKIQRVNRLESTTIDKGEILYLPN